MACFNEIGFEDSLNVVSKDFIITIEDHCETQLTGSVGSMADQTYTIAREELVLNIPTTTDVSPDYCPELGYGIGISPPLPVENASAIIVDNSAQTLTVFSESIDSSGVYTVTVTTLTPSGKESDMRFSFQLTIVDPCLDAQLTINESIF